MSPKPGKVIKSDIWVLDVPMELQQREDISFILQRNSAEVGQFVGALLSLLFERDPVSFHKLARACGQSEKPAKKLLRPEVLLRDPSPPDVSDTVSGSVAVPTEGFQGPPATPPAKMAQKPPGDASEQFSDFRKSPVDLPSATSEPVTDKPARLTVLEGGKADKEPEVPSEDPPQKKHLVMQRVVRPGHRDIYQAVMYHEPKAPDIHLPAVSLVGEEYEPLLIHDVEKQQDELLEHIHYPGNSTAADVLESYLELKSISDLGQVCPRHWKQIDMAREKRRGILLKWREIWKPLRESLQELQEKEAKAAARDKRLLRMKRRTKEQELRAFEEKIQLGKRPELRTWLEARGASGDDLELPVFLKSPAS